MRYSGPSLKHKGITLTLLLIGFLTPSTSGEATRQISKRAIRIDDGGPFPAYIALGQPVAPPTCSAVFGGPRTSHCQRAAGGSRSAQPVGGMEWERIGINLSKYYGGWPQVPPVTASSFFIMPKTYAYSKLKPFLRNLFLAPAQSRLRGMCYLGARCSDAWSK